MVQTISNGNKPTMNGIDPALKPRLRRRSTFEYVAWVVSILLGAGILFSVSTNPNFKWDVVAKYFTHESILRGLMLTIFLTVASMALGTLLGLVIAIMRSSSVKPTKAAVIGPISAFVSIAVPMSVNGMPMVRFGYKAEMLNQKISWTRTGVPRNRVI